MADSKKRTYRRLVKPVGLVTFQVAIKETDLLLAAATDLSEETRTAVLTQRRFIEERIRSQPQFLTSLEPLAPDPLAPEIIREMLSAAEAAGTGPMAAVAGALAGQVGRALMAASPEVIVENGGDLFLGAARDLKVALMSGSSSLSGKIFLTIPSASQPVGLSTSSGRVGPSLSLGRAHAATVLADSPALADALATALGNRIQTRADSGPALEWLADRPGVRGGLVIIGAEMAAWGHVQLAPA